MTDFDRGLTYRFVFYWECDDTSSELPTPKIEILDSQYENSGQILDNLRRGPDKLNAQNVEQKYYLIVIDILLFK